MHDTPSNSMYTTFTLSDISTHSQKHTCCNYTLLLICNPDATTSIGASLVLTNKHTLTHARTHAHTHTHALNAGTQHARTHAKQHKTLKQHRCGTRHGGTLAPRWSRHRLQSVGTARKFCECRNEKGDCHKCRRDISAGQRRRECVVWVSLCQKQHECRKTSKHINIHLNLDEENRYGMCQFL